MLKKIAALLSVNSAAASVQPVFSAVPAGKRAVYLTDSEINTMRQFMSVSARVLQVARKQDKMLSQVLYEMSDKEQADNPLVAASFRALNATKDRVRKSRKMEKNVNSVIKALRASAH